MRGTFIIAAKEIKSFIMSPTFFVILFLVSGMMSFIYPIQLQMFNQMLMSYVARPDIPTQQLNIHYGVFLRLLSYLNLMLIFIVPALTMRMIAEEKKMRTFDLLLTSPITSFEIVLGKYFAVLTAIGVLMVVTFLYPLSTSLFAKINWLPLFIAFMGIYLVAAVYAAMNLFCSSLTESALIAYVMSVIFNVAIWFIGMSAEVVDGQSARQVFEHLSLNTHLSSLVEGTIRTSGLIFLISVVALFVFLAERVVESTRWRA